MFIRFLCIYRLTLCRRDPKSVSNTIRIWCGFKRLMISWLRGVRSSCLVFLKGVLTIFQIINMEFSFCTILLFVWYWIDWKYHEPVLKKDWRPGGEVRWWICPFLITERIVCQCLALFLLLGVLLLSIRDPIDRSVPTSFNHFWLDDWKRASEASEGCSPLLASEGLVSRLRRQRASEPPPAAKG